MRVDPAGCQATDLCSSRNAIAEGWHHVMDELDSPYIIPSPEPAAGRFFSNGRRAAMSAYIKREETTLAANLDARREMDLAAELAVPGRWSRLRQQLPF